MAAAAHRLLAACHVLSGLLAAAEGAGHLDSTARARLEADVSAMSQALGACEKVRGSCRKLGEVLMPHPCRVTVVVAWPVAPLCRTCLHP